MKKNYLKPDAQYLELDIEERIMDTVIDGSMDWGEEDDEGI